jgi:hypothetical protein
MASLNVLTWLTAYLDECAATAASRSPRRRWNGSCPGTPAAKTSAPRHSHCPPYKPRTNNAASGRATENHHVGHRHALSQDFRILTVRSDSLPATHPIGFPQACDCGCGDVPSLFRDLLCRGGLWAVILACRALKLSYPWPVSVPGSATTTWPAPGAVS